MGICGTEDQWQRGASINDPIPANYLNTSVPRCCKRPPLYARGGVAVGGPGVPGPCCEGVTLPTDLTVRFYDLVPLCNQLNNNPFLMGLVVGPPPPAFPSARWVSVNEFDFGGGFVGRFYIGCRPEFPFPWWMFLIAPDGTVIMFWDFIEWSCLPFRAWTNGASIPFVMGDCDIITGNIEVLAA